MKILSFIGLATFCLLCVAGDMRVVEYSEHYNKDSDRLLSAVGIKGSIYLDTITIERGGTKYICYSGGQSIRCTPKNI